MALVLGTGTTQKEDFNLIIKNSLRSAPSEITTYTIQQIESGCCFELPALAETVYTSDYKNDYMSVITWWGIDIASVTMYLQKYSNGSWTNVATLNGNTYGTFYTLGFYTTIDNEKAIGFNLKWENVLIALGEGNYRIKTTATSITSETINKYSFDYCLKEYTDNRADRTIRVEWWLNGIIGDKDFDDQRNDYSNKNWANQIRLPESKFGYTKDDVERTFVKYQGGENIWLKDESIPEFTLKTGRYTADLHNFIKYNLLKGDKISITDYNTNNAERFIDKYVVPNGGYSPNWVDGSIHASCEIKFNAYYQRHEHKRC